MINIELEKKRNDFITPFRFVGQNDEEKFLTAVEIVNNTEHCPPK